MTVGIVDRMFCESASVPPRFVKDAYKRVGMKDQALAALTHILVRCTDYRYDVLEVFSVGEVFLALLSFSCS